jgi:hypothetical protein
VEEGLELRQFQFSFPDGELDFLHKSEDLANNGVNPSNCYTWKLSERWPLLGFKMVDEVDYFVPCSHAFEYVLRRILQYICIPPAHALQYPFSGPKTFLNLGTQL